MHLITFQAKDDQQPADTHTHTPSSFLGTQINTEALQKSNEEEDIGERNAPLAQTTHWECKQR